MGRDIRMFEISEELPDGTLEDKLIRPIFSSSPVVLPETAPSALYYRYALGRGVGVMDNIARHLDEGVLPIYHSELTDDDVRYHSVSFVSLEKSELNAGNVQGTHFLISDSRSGGRVFTETQQKQLADIQAAIPPADEEAVLYIRTEIENEGAVPRYAWIKAPRPAMPTNNLYIGAAYQFDREKGFSFFSEDRVFCISTIKGKPLCNEELAVLLQPGERIEVNFYIPHEPGLPTAGRRTGRTVVRKTLRSVQGLLERETRARRPYPCPGKKDRRDGPRGPAAFGPGDFRAGAGRDAGR